MVAIVALVACTGGDQFTYSGYPMNEFFPFDGQRTWEFENEDATVDHTLVATLNTEPEALDGGVFVYTVDYTKGCLERDDTDAAECTGGEPWRVSRIRWSSSQGDGVEIHSFDDTNGTTSFEPPLVIAGDRGGVSDSWVTDTTGGAFTSRFVSIGECPVVMEVDWDECVRIHVDDDGDEGTAGTHPLHGDWYAVAGFNVIALALKDDPGRWRLSGTTYSPLE